jgi:hypothetical protein
VPAHQRLGNAAVRAPAHLRLIGPHIPARGRRRISPPDAEGWREVLSRQTDVRGTAVANEQRAVNVGHRALRRRRIPDAMRDRCLNCLSFTHRLATCRLPLRC